MLSLKRSKLGFTLVELIVVLVILAILAGFLVPTLTKYIDRANKRAVVAEARSLYVALQALSSEAYGDNKIPQAFDERDTTPFSISDVRALAETTEGTLTYSVSTSAQITAFTYKNNKYTATYNTSSKSFDVT